MIGICMFSVTLLELEGNVELYSKSKPSDNMGPKAQLTCGKTHQLLKGLWVMSVSHVLMPFHLDRYHWHFNIQTYSHIDSMPASVASALYISSCGQLQQLKVHLLGHLLQFTLFLG